MGFKKFLTLETAGFCQDDLTDMIDGLCSVKKKEGSASLESQKRDGLLSRLNLGNWKNQKIFVFVKKIHEPRNFKS